MLVAVLFCCNYKAKAQTFNYVANPSLELHDTCPNGADNLYLAKGWDTLKAGGGGGAELYVMCDDKSCNCNSFSELYQYPRTGNFQGNMFLYIDAPIAFFYRRDYAQVKLKQTLTATKNYCVTFFVSLTTRSGLAIDNIGGYLDDGSIQTPYYSWVIKTPQIQSLTGVFISDTLNWVKIQGSFTAIGNESYLTLGNFKSDSLTDSIRLQYSYSPGSIAEYFFDDVSIVESNSKINAGNDTTIALGDSILLGKSIEGLPVEWYDIQGNLLANSSEVQVKPTETTSYVVKMDLCGFVSYDTVQIKVGDVGISAFSSSNSQFTISPNPTNSATIILCNNQITNATIKLLNLTGQTIFEKQNQTGNQFYLDILQQPQGIYFIEVHEQDKIWRSKIVKQ